VLSTFGVFKEFGQADGYYRAQQQPNTHVRQSQCRNQYKTRCSTIIVKADQTTVLPPSEFLMTQPKMKANSTRTVGKAALYSAFASCLFVSAMWFGEDLFITIETYLFVQLAVASIVLAAGSIGAVVFRPRWRAPSIALLYWMICLAGMSVGGKSETAAFNDCVSHGEAVRVQLSTYRSEHGSFPTSLADLEQGPACGKRWTRQPILTYQRLSDSEYSLLFSDWLVVHQATHNSQFQAFQ
jgi:hypothetical protein